MIILLTKRSPCWGRVVMCLKPTLEATVFKTRPHPQIQRRSSCHSHSWRHGTDSSCTLALGPVQAPPWHSYEWRMRLLSMWDTLFLSRSLSGRRSTWLHFQIATYTHLKMTGTPGLEKLAREEYIQETVQTSSIIYRFFNYRVIEYDINLEILQGKPIIFLSDDIQL